MIFKSFALCLSFLAFTCAADEVRRNLRHKSKSTPSIVEIASDKDNADLFSTLTGAVVAAGLADALNCRSYWCKKYTVFAPTNEAFAALQKAEPELFKKLTEDKDYKEHLRKLLLYHIVYGKIRSSQIEDGEVTSVQGEKLELSTKGGIIVDEANVIEPFDVHARNGIIHTVDTVLTPSFITEDIVSIASSNDDFSELVKLLGDEGLDKALQGEGPFTVFAPSNKAFEKLKNSGIDLTNVNLADVLKYHVVEGIVLSTELSEGKVPTLLEGNEIDVSFTGYKWTRRVELNGVERLVATDILAKNGVIHVIDEVLLPKPAVRQALPSIVDIVVGNEDFSILEKALTDTDLVGALQAIGEPITVFAPPDKAFEALPKGALSDLDVVKDILLFHVVVGEFLRDDLPSSGLVEALNENTIAIKSGRSGVELNFNTHVDKFDIEASDGVIHVVDKVLIPPKNIVEVATEAGEFETLLTAIGEVPGLAQTLLEEGPFTIFAPTDKAFAKIPQAELNAILQDEPLLARILQYHVVEGFVPLCDLPEGNVPTLTGENIFVDIRYWVYWWRYWVKRVRSVILNRKVHVEAVDILATNAVIHKIDSVLLPPSTK